MLCKDSPVVGRVESHSAALTDGAEPRDGASTPVEKHRPESHRGASRATRRAVNACYLLHHTAVDGDVEKSVAAAARTPQPPREPTPSARGTGADDHAPHPRASRITAFEHAP